MLEHGIISGVLRALVRRHGKKIDEKYSERRLRLYQPVHWALQKVWANEQLAKAFDAKFIDDVRDHKKDADESILRIVSILSLLTVFISYALSGQEIELRIFGIKLSSDDGSILLAIVLSSVFLFYLTEKLILSISYYLILDAYAHLIIPQVSEDYDGNEFYRNIYKAKFSEDIWDSVARRFTIKVKYILNPRPFYILSEYIKELCILIFVFVILGCWIFNIYKIFSDTEFLILLKVLVVSLFGASILYLFFSLAATFNVLTGILAKGRREIAEQTSEPEGR